MRKKPYFHGNEHRVHKKQTVTIFMKDYIKECKEAYKEAGEKLVAEVKH